jgi:hypothetical protein
MGALRASQQPILRLLQNQRPPRLRIGSRFRIDARQTLPQGPDEIQGCFVISVADLIEVLIIRGNRRLLTRRRRSSTVVA